jgi:hypothetical protein
MDKIILTTPNDLKQIFADILDEKFAMYSLYTPLSTTPPDEKLLNTEETSENDSSASNHWNEIREKYGLRSKGLDELADIQY